MTLPHKGQFTSAIVACGLAFVLVSGCSSTTGAGKVTAWNPTTWFSGSAGRTTASANAKVDEAQAKIVKAAQKTAHETKEALVSAPESRPVVVAREAAGQTVTLLDQAAGPLTMEESTRIREQVTKLVSENVQLRQEGEKMRNEARDGMAELSAKLAKAEAGAENASKGLQAAFARENELANQLRNQRFLLIVAVSVAAIGYLGVLYLRFAYGGIPAAIGRGLTQLRTTHPESGDLATKIFDSYLNRNEQHSISRHS